MRRALLLASAALLILWFVAFSLDAFAAWFTGDHLMNTYYYYRRSGWRLIAANLMLSDYYRPMGGVYYDVLYRLFGINSPPFHVIGIGLLGVNCWLLYRVCVRLSGRAEAGLVAVAAVGAHPAMYRLFYDTGAIYDVLAFFFSFAMLLWYLRIRQSGRVPGVLETVGLAYLFVAALNSKEIAIGLPALVLLYELLWTRPLRRPFRELWTGLFLLLPATAYVWTRYVGREPLASQPLYVPHFTVAAYFESVARYVGQWAYAERAEVVVIVIAAAAVVLSRSRFALWSLAFALISILPLAFIEPRGMFAFYVPAAGWAMLLGALLVRVPRCELILPVAIAAILALHWRAHSASRRTYTTEQDLVRRHYDLLLPVLPPAPPDGTRFFIAKGAEGPGDWITHWLIELHYGRQSIAAHPTYLVPLMKLTPADYDYLVEFDGARYSIRDGPRRAAAPSHSGSASKR